MKAITEKSKMQKVNPIYPNTNQSTKNDIKKDFIDVEVINKFETQYTKNNIPKEKVYISTSKIAESLNQPIEKIYKIFDQLKWTEKRGKWILTTEKGKINGAKQEYDEINKQKYVMWDIKILENLEFKNMITNLKNKPTMTNKEKGDMYEAYVAKFFREKGYFVWEYGKEKGIEDGGMDLFVKIGEFAYFVQCRNWEKWEKKEWQINQDTVLAAQKKIENLLQKEDSLRNIISNCKQKILYVTSKDILNPGAKRYIKEYNEIIEHHIIPIEETYL
ncbi:MAG: restriction endonuclease [Thiovulaceae bacterium]|nr:restriction endonuclease [Sulfurimonadaceae bacterium]